MISFYLNGKSQSISADPKMPILWVLRDVLNFTGTKYGCGAGLCGACTVLLDDNPIRSCITPISFAEGKQITTVEGLEKENSDLLDNWQKENVPQCGFCQSGQLVTAAALLQNNTNPGDDEIEIAMSGNICRCGTYSRIKKAIKETIKGRG